MANFSTGLISKLFGEYGTDTGANGLRGLMKDGVVRVYQGAQPTSADDPPTGTLLGSVTLNGGAFVEGSATNGLELGAPSGKTVSKSGSETWKFTGVAAGTMQWFRFQANAVDDDSSSTSLVRIDGSVGVTSGEMRVTTTAATVGGSVTIDTFTITAA